MWFSSVAYSRPRLCALNATSCSVIGRHDRRSHEHPAGIFFFIVELLLIDVNTQLMCIWTDDSACYAAGTPWTWDKTTMLRQAAPGRRYDVASGSIRYQWLTYDSNQSTAVLDRAAIVTTCLPNSVIIKTNECSLATICWLSRQGSHSHNGAAAASINYELLFYGHEFINIHPCHQRGTVV